jgi:hypothetical protein
MVHIVENIRDTNDPEEFLETLVSRVERYREEGLLTVSSDLKITYNILGPEDEAPLPDGFRINTVDRLLAYVTICFILYQVFVSGPEEDLEVNQMFIERCENCYIEFRGDE